MSFLNLLGSRRDPSFNKRFEQGHPGYTNSVIANMRKAYNNYDRQQYDIDSVYRQEVVNLKSTLDAFELYENKIDYTVVRQSFNSLSDVHSYFTVAQFDQSIGN